MKLFTLLSLVCAIGAQAQERIRPAPTVERLKADKPLVEEAINKSELYYQEFLLLPPTRENLVKVARMKAENDKAKVRLQTVENEIATRAKP